MSPIDQNGILVQKYGGSSLSSVSAIKAVAKLIRAKSRSGKKMCVVVSAMGNTTNDLLKMLQEISNTPPKRELAMLLTCGERISMSLLASALEEIGVASMSFTGSQSGIIIDENFENASILEVRPSRVQKALNDGYVAIVAGFQGVSAVGKNITTLGRGGSDTSAVYLAAALGSKNCEIYSDVDGVYSADPKRLSAEKPIKSLSYDEMLVLSQNGAQVIHSPAVACAKKESIQIFAKKTGSKLNGTQIGDKFASYPPAHAITSANKKTLVKITSPAGFTFFAQNIYGSSNLKPLHTVCTDALAAYEILNQPDSDLTHPGIEVIQRVSKLTALTPGGLERGIYLEHILAYAQDNFKVIGFQLTARAIQAYVLQNESEELLKALHAISMDFAQTTRGAGFSRQS